MFYMSSGSGGMYSYVEDITEIHSCMCSYRFASRSGFMAVLVFVVLTFFIDLILCKSRICVDEDYACNNYYYCS